MIRNYDTFYNCMYTFKNKLIDIKIVCMLCERSGVSIARQFDDGQNSQRAIRGAIHSAAFDAQATANAFTRGPRERYLVIFFSYVSLILLGYSEHQQQT